MLAFLVVLVLGTAIGYARGGSVANVARARLHWTWLVFASVALQAAGQFVPSGMSQLAFVTLVASYAVLFLFAARNRTVPGMAFIAFGALCNFVVIAANGGMPISAAAAREAGFSGEEAQRLVVRGKHFIAEPGDAQLMFLADVIPLWRQPSVASIGDLIIWAGMILLIQALMQDPRGRRLRGTAEQTP